MVPISKAKLQIAENLTGDASLEKIRNHLVNEKGRKLKRRGAHLKKEDLEQIHAVVREIPTLCDLYREAIYDRVHSERVRAILADFDSLKSLIKPWTVGPLTDQQHEKVRNRIKGFQHSSRNWIGLLPLRPGVKQLPDSDVASGIERAAKLKALWKAVGAAIFLPPPRQGPGLDGAPAWLQIPTDLPAWMLADNFTSLAEDQQGGWKCEPAEMVALLDFAEEVFLLEVGGRDRGGKTTLAQRLMRSSAKDSFALSCLLLYERAVGASTARQTNSSKNAGGGSTGTPFEKFCVMVLTLAVGTKPEKDWKLGPDPIRRAIATNRAWLKLFQAAGCANSAEFHALPEGARQQALQQLSAATRKKLMPSAPPWV